MLERRSISSWILAAWCAGAAAYGCSTKNDAASADDAGADAAAEADAPRDAGPADGGTDADAAPAPDCAEDDAGDGIPSTLRCAGLYADWSTKALAPDVQPFTPGYTLWSDGAAKQRWLYLPPGAKIDTSNPDEWTFPVGTKTFKEFRLGGKRIETRFYWKKAPGKWVWTVYRWNEAETETHRLDNGEQNVGGTTYEIPSHSQCEECHGGRRDLVLGVEAIGLAAAGAQGHGATAASLAAEGRFTHALPAGLELPDDGSGNARGSLGWLHANCGTACHNKNPEAIGHFSGLYLRVDVAALAVDGGATARIRATDAWKTAVGVAPTNADFAGRGFKRIARGDVAHSMVAFVAENRDRTKPVMPPLLTRVPDTPNVTVLKAWIANMPDGG